MQLIQLGVVTSLECLSPQARAAMQNFVQASMGSGCRVPRAQPPTPLQAACWWLRHLLRCSPREPHRLWTFRLPSFWRWSSWWGASLALTPPAVGGGGVPGGVRPPANCSKGKLEVARHISRVIACHAVLHRQLLTPDKPATHPPLQACVASSPRWPSCCCGSARSTGRARRSGTSRPSWRTACRTACATRATPARLPTLRRRPRARRRRPQVSASSSS